MSRTVFAHLPDSASSTAALRRGFLLGALGVVIFAITLPMTRLAVVFIGRRLPVRAAPPR